MEDKLIKQLDKQWSKFRDSGIGRDDSVEQYRNLMIKSFPLILERWIKKSDAVDKDIAALLCTMTSIFNAGYDEDGNFLADGDLEDYAFFHDCFINDVVYGNCLRMDGDTIFVEDFEVDTSNFELDC